MITIILLATSSSRTSTHSHERYLCDLEEKQQQHAKHDETRRGFGRALGRVAQYAPPSQDDDAPHRTVRLPTSLRIHRDTYQRDAPAAIAIVVPAGALGDDAIGKELLKGPLFAECAVARRMSLDRNDLTITDTRPDVAFELSLEICAS